MTKTLKPVRKYYHPPKFEKGEKVIVYFLDSALLRTIKDINWNGYTWMYSFEEIDMNCGEEYLIKVRSK